MARTGFAGATSGTGGIRLRYTSAISRSLSTDQCSNRGRETWSFARPAPLPVLGESVPERQEPGEPLARQALHALGLGRRNVDDGICLEQRRVAAGRFQAAGQGLRGREKDSSLASVVVIPVGRRTNRSADAAFTSCLAATSPFQITWRGQRGRPGHPSLRDHEPDLRDGQWQAASVARSRGLGAAVVGPAREGDGRARGLPDAGRARSGAARRFGRQGLLSILLPGKRRRARKRAVTAAISGATAARRRGRSPGLARAEGPTRACIAPR